MEYRFTALRALDANTLEGVVVRYSDVAQIGALSERIEAGAFSPLPQDATLNVQHDRASILARGSAGLTLEDSATALTMRAALPDTPRAAQAMADVQAGLLRGLSVEMEVLEDSVIGAMRTITRAVLHGMAVVDRPAYSQSAIQARESMIHRTRARRRLWL